MIRSSAAATAGRSLDILAMAFTIISASSSDGFLWFAVSLPFGYTHNRTPAIFVLDTVISAGVALDLPRSREGLKYPVPFVCHGWTLATLSAKIKL
jgi:hypothetical protein